jgi:hypothetical protein
MSISFFSLVQGVLKKYSTMTTSIKVQKDLENIKSNDIVIESLWAIVNFVAAFCHNRHASVYPNFWVDFLDNFEANYLKPLISQW